MAFQFQCEQSGRIRANYERITFARSTLDVAVRPAGATWRDPSQLSKMRRDASLGNFYPNLRDRLYADASKE